ncbi:MAG: MFS transporter [Nitrospirota bacterium]|nr:MFS transporter [Nitrospirota bacterium]
MLKESVRALRSGHWPSLLGAWLHFEVSFMVWLLIGALSIAISEEFALSGFQKGVLVGVPLLGGALLRIVIGPLGDWVGAKTVGLGILGLEALALLLGWQWGTSFGEILVVGLILGIAGASFAIALPIASQAYPPAHQGLAMGVAAVGNSGVLLTSLFAPRLAAAFGWHQVFALMLVPVLGTACLFLWLVQPSSLPPPSDKKDNAPHFLSLLAQGLQQQSIYWLCGLYAVTFGGFVGLSSYLPIYFHDQFQVDMVTAGSLTAVSALAGSVARPLGGFFADRFGGLRLLEGLFVLIMILCLMSVLSSTIVWALIIVLAIMLCLGFGNGVIFQVVSCRFPGIMGTASGLIGAAGGLGGFFLPTCFGWLKDSTGTFSMGFFVFGFVSGFAALSVMIVQRSTRFDRPKSVSES